MNGTNIARLENPAMNLTGSPTIKEQVFEVLTFCFLIVPGLAFSFMAGPAVKENFLFGVSGVVLSDVALVTLICFFLWHNGEKLGRIGWVSKGFIKEIIIGIVLFFPLIYAMSFVDSWLQSAGLDFPKGHVPSFLKPVGTVQQIVMTFLVVVVAISEETIFRGYLILRFKAVTGSATVAVIVSSIIFSLGHGYEGLGGAVSIGIMGAFFALIYLWRKSLVAPMVMHFMQDFIAIVFVSVMANK
jgi:membrane protease YdiL (CAAX protease family)